MREYPILFNGEMVRAILEGRKTQTRRVVKPQPAGAWAAPGKTTCPYGQLGDRLWVRETFDVCELVRDVADEAISRSINWRATDDMGRWEGVMSGRYDIAYRADGSDAHEGRWRPSIHMPRWACRTVLEVVSVRVERLCGITDADAVAEGYACAEAFLLGDWAAPLDELNPWVWAVEFGVVTP